MWCYEYNVRLGSSFNSSNKDGQTLPPAFLYIFWKLADIDQFFVVPPDIRRLAKDISKEHI